MRRLRKMLIYLALFVIVGGVVVVGGWYVVTTSVERPAYRVVQADGAIERRAYPSMVAAEVQTRGQRWDAVRAGFRPLAGYIFARERGGDKIAMTAPVTQHGADDGTWAIRFLMPAKYDIHDLPDPANGQIRLTPVPAGERMAIRFSGVATDALLDRHEQRLRDWMRDHGLTPKGPATFAYYNDPMTPGFLRRNEVLLSFE